MNRSANDLRPWTQEEGGWRTCGSKTCRSMILLADETAAGGSGSGGPGNRGVVLSHPLPKRQGIFGARRGSGRRGLPVLPLPQGHGAFVPNFFPRISRAINAVPTNTVRFAEPPAAC